MRLAIVGGTGDVGGGLALRWGRDTSHDIVIGSRDPERATGAASRYADRLEARGYTPHLEGDANAGAVEGADVVVVAVPPYTVTDAIADVADRLPADATLVSPAVGMRGDDEGMHYHRPSAGSVTALAADAAPEGVAVVGAFHSVPAARLLDLDDPLELDTFVVGDDPAARSRVHELAAAIDGIRAIDAGPLANAPEVEGLTPLLINVARYNDGFEEAGCRVVTPSGR